MRTLRYRKGIVWTALALCLSMLAGCGSAAPASKPAASSKPASSGKPASSTSSAASSTSGGSSTTAAASSSGGAQSTSAPKKLTKVDLRFPWLVGGYDEPYVLGVKRGYYKAVGIDLTVGQGKGSATAVETVGNGSDTFGVADSGTAAQLISKGEPVKILAVLPANTLLSFVAREALSSPKDLIGKTIYTSAGDADYVMLPAVLHKYGMTKSQLKIQLLSPSGIPVAYKKNPNSVMLGFVGSNDLDGIRLVPKSVVTPFSKFGINPYGPGLITSDKEIQQHPGLVRRFVAASIRSWKAAMADPQAAIAATAARFPHASSFKLSKGLKQMFPIMQTAATKGHPLGWMAASQWKTTLQLLQKYVGMKTVKPLNDYYTNAFLPKS